MTLEQLEEWMEEAEWVDGRSEYDNMSNERSCRIFLHDEQHYVVYFCNGHPSEEWGDKGYIRGQYQPIPVQLETETIVVEKYILPDGNDIDWLM